MKRMKPALAPSSLRAVSAITQVTNCFMVSLRLGAGVGKQIFDPPEFSRSVCTTPWANPLQKLSRATLPGLVGLAEQATARSPAVLNVDTDRWSFWWGSNSWYCPGHCQIDDRSHAMFLAKCHESRQRQSEFGSAGNFLNVPAGWRRMS